MSVMKICKNIFYFLRYYFIKIFSAMGVLLIMVGCGGVFFAQKSQDFTLYFYLTIALIGYVIITITSCFNLSVTNRREMKSSHSLRGGK